MFLALRLERRKEAMEEKGKGKGREEGGHRAKGRGGRGRWREAEKRRRPVPFDRPKQSRRVRRVSPQDPPRARSGSRRAGFGRWHKESICRGQAQRLLGQNSRQWRQQTTADATKGRLRTEDVLAIVI